jgi:hypothetical protein
MNVKGTIKNEQSIIHWQQWANKTQNEDKQTNGISKRNTTQKKNKAPRVDTKRMVSSFYFL